MRSLAQAGIEFLKFLWRGFRKLLPWAIVFIIIVSYNNSSYADKEYYNRQINELINGGLEWLFIVGVIFGLWKLYQD